MSTFLRPLIDAPSLMSILSSHWTSHKTRNANMFNPLESLLKSYMKFSSLRPFVMSKRVRLFLFALLTFTIISLFLALFSPVSSLRSELTSPPLLPCTDFVDSTSKDCLPLAPTPPPISPPAPPPPVPVPGIGLTGTSINLSIIIPVVIASLVVCSILTFGCVNCWDRPRLIDCPCTLDLEPLYRRRRLGGGGEMEAGTLRYRHHDGECTKDPEARGTSEGMRILGEFGCLLCMRSSDEY